MDAFQIEGPVRLQGRIRVNGSKNAALPIMAAAILAGGPCRFSGIPNLSDIRVLIELLQHLGCKVEREADGRILVDSTVIDKPFGDYEIVRKMRASICILGPLVARCGRAEVSMPGGCAIGDRPINLHLRGLRELGARIHLKNGYVIAETLDNLKGASIFLGGSFGSTVLGTANVMMAAVLATGAPSSSRPPASPRSPTSPTSSTPWGRRSPASARPDWSSKASRNCTRSTTP